MTKEIIRNKIKATRKEMAHEDLVRLSEIIEDKIIGINEFKTAERIYIYIDLNNEVKTDKIIQYCFDNKKRVFVPKVNGKTMNFHEIHSFSELTEGAFHVMEPVNNIPDDKNSGIIIVPGVAFDTSCNRMGYGGGYYDRFFQQNNAYFKIAICFDYQLLEKLDVESFDVKMNMVVTESMEVLA